METEADDMVREYLAELSELSESCAHMVEETAVVMSRYQTDLADMSRQARIVVEQQRRLAALVDRNRTEIQTLLDGFEARLANRISQARRENNRRVVRLWVGGGILLGLLVIALSSVIGW